MNTAEERAEAAAIDVEGRQARFAEILGKSTTGGQDAAIEDTRRRKPAVRGMCVNCGKHFSRHYTYQNESYCNKNSTVRFSLEREAEPAAQVAGGLSQQQVEKIRTLAEAKIQALEAHTQSERIMIDACETLDAYLDSLVSK